MNFLICEEMPFYQSSFPVCLISKVDQYPFSVFFNSVILCRIESNFLEWACFKVIKISSTSYFNIIRRFCWGTVLLSYWLKFCTWESFTTLLHRTRILSVAITSFSTNKRTCISGPSLTPRTSAFCSLVLHLYHMLNLQHIILFTIFHSSIPVNEQISKIW